MVALLLERMEPNAPSESRRWWGGDEKKVMMKRNASFTPIKVLLANNGDIPVDAQFLNADWGGQDQIVKLSIPREKVSIDA